MTLFRKSVTALPVLGMTLILCACGGGGDDSAGGNPPPPPPASAYTLQLIDVSLVDTVSGLAVDATGLPVSGATARRN